MEVRQWFIGKEGEQKEGPFTFQELKEKRERDEIKDDTPIWSEKFGSWIPFIEILNQELFAHDTPVASEEPETAVKFEEEELMVKERASRPWVRFWARMIDYNLFAICLGLIFGYVLAYFPVMRMPILYPIVVTFLWVWVESILLSTWGYTPGKWFLRVKLQKKEEGSKVTFRQAIERSLLVWFLGMGAGIPIIVLITLVVANVKLSNIGVTTWDKRIGLTVQHGRIGPVRTSITILFFVAIGVLLLAQYRHLL